MKRLRNLLSLARRKPALAQTPADVVHRENKWRLLRYRARPEGLAFDTPIVMVPSLINRHYVLDLSPGKSFVEFLVDRGHDVFIIDWGTPGAEDRYLTFDDIADRYIGRAIRVAARAAAVDRVHLFGYCLGGTLSTVHLAVHPERVASHVTFAAPIQFEHAGMMATWTRSPAFDVGAIVDAFGNVPWPLMQASFHMLRPTLNLAKAVTLIDRAWDDEFLDGFLAIETWGADNVSFPGEAYRRYIEALYRDDQLIKGTFTLSGAPARLEAIEAPSLAVTFANDHIVPEACARPLIDRISSPDKQHLHLPGGHVGAVVSRKAARGLWPTIAEWWEARDGLGVAHSPGPRPLSPSMKATASGHDSRS